MQAVPTKEYDGVRQPFRALVKRNGPTRKILGGAPRKTTVQSRFLTGRSSSFTPLSSTSSKPSLAKCDDESCSTADASLSSVEEPKALVEAPSLRRPKHLDDSPDIPAKAQTSDAWSSSSTRAKVVGSQPSSVKVSIVNSQESHFLSSSSLERLPAPPRNRARSSESFDGAHHQFTAAKSEERDAEAAKRKEDDERGSAPQDAFKKDDSATTARKENEQLTEVDERIVTTNACPKCTFENALTATNCAICETRLRWAKHRRRR